MKVVILLLSALLVLLSEVSFGFRTNGWVRKNHLSQNGLEKLPRSSKSVLKGVLFGFEWDSVRIQVEWGSNTENQIATNVKASTTSSAFGLDRGVLLSDIPVLNEPKVDADKITKAMAKLYSLEGVKSV